MPIVSGIQILSHKARKLFDDYLQLYMESLPLYLKGKIHLLMILDNLHADEETILVSVEVKVLYSSIPHSNGINMARSFLKERGIESKHYNNFVVELLEFILTHNVFYVWWRPLPPDTWYGNGDDMFTACTNVYMGGGSSPSSLMIILSNYSIVQQF